MALYRNTLVILVVAALAATSITPSLARPNDGRYQKSAEKMRQTISSGPSYCDDLKTALDYDEKEADKRAGTKAAKPYADEADWLWGQGVKAGCSWAA
ncbi:MAG: hypothetical protein HY834_19410 [Devosia nanyangense]|uniref:DUF732 domain-containing protein n=1 Tax=Devosia nanyangense TaxID=1228055 RepID=A0A933L6G1_9HYPH|nr:hypothetical protein [Devosia nanyangense]